MDSLRVAVLFIAVAGPGSAQLPVYHVTDLGSLTGTVSAANAISNNGTYVAGVFNTPGVQANTAFLYSAAGGAVSLGTLGGVSIATGVNNTGQVSGYSVPNQNHAFLYSNGALTDLGTLATGSASTTQSFGLAINNLGRVVGYSNVSAANFHQFDAFLYATAMQDLGLPPNALSSYAAAINDSGLIAGYYNPDSATTHAFSLSNGTYTDLGTLAGAASGTQSTAAAISANGLIAGYSTLANGSSVHAFLYSGGVMRDLGTLAGTVSRASGVNSNGDVVGASFWSGSGFHGFLYSGGVLLDINNLLDPTSTGYTITGAAAISEGGAIAATGTTPGGAAHALLLTPISIQSQTITFDPIPNQIFGGSPFPIAVQSSSGLPLTIASTTPAVCANVSGLVILLSAGVCTIKASQPGNLKYGAAAPVSRSFTVSLANASGTLQGPAGSPFTVGSGPRSVVAADFNGDGLPDLATANYAEGTVTVLLANHSGGFTAASGSPSSAGSNPQSLAVGDFNGDGFADLAVADSGGGGVTVLLGNGSGGFTATAASPIAAGSQPVSLAVGDFNGDGIQDLAVANFSGNTLAILLGNGSGGFTAAAGSPILVGTNPLSVAVGDFNGDGFQDLAAANSGDGTVTVLLGTGTGAFAAAAASPFQVGSGPDSVAVGDFDGNGKLDLAVANSGGKNVTVLLGDGSGGFRASASSPFGAGSGPHAVVVADLNGDGIPDLATANSGSGNVTVLLGNGSGGFAASVGGPITVGASPFGLAVADFNGDGIPDLAAANSGGASVTVLLGGKDPTTAVLSTISPSVVAVGQNVPLTLTVSEGAPPFAALSGSATFLDGNTPLGAAGQTASPYTFNTSSLAVGTHSLSAAYGGDSRTAGSTSNSLSITVSGTLAAQTITFGPLANQTLGATPPALSASASSGLPVTFTSNTPGVCTVAGAAVTLVAVGTCSLTASQPGNAVYAAALPVTASFTVLAAQTITFDPIPNQIFGISPFPVAARSSSGLPVTFLSSTPAVCSNAGSLVLLLAPGACSLTTTQGGNASIGAAAPVTRTFTVIRSTGAAALTPAAGSPFSTGTNPNALAIGDVNGDGNPDLLVANQGSNSVTVLLGNGSGGFTPDAGNPFSVGAAPSSLVLGDFNLDGNLDFATANLNDGTVTVMLGDGLGGFSAASGSPVNVGKKPNSLVVGDFNDDGVPDLAVANNGDGTVTVLLGNGSGGFAPSAGSPFPGGSSANSIAVGDFNGDGIQDLAIADLAFASGSEVVLLGNGSGGFTAASYSPLAAGYLADYVAVGDFNRDGIPDLATASLFGNNVTALLGKQSGGFTPASGSPFSVGSAPFGVVVADINGDGFPDLAVANSGGGSVTLLLGNGSGGFAQPAGSPLTVGSGPEAIAVGDFNRDGVEDLAVGNGGSGNVTVLLGGQVSTTSVLSTTSPSTILVGQAVPLTLTVTKSGQTFGPLTGPATFFDGTTALGTATQTASPYTFSAALAAGSHSLTATFGGGGGGMPSTSNAIPILVLSPCDLNQDGKTDVMDVQSGINQALGLAKAVSNLDGSGEMTVVADQIVINAAINRGCSAKTK